MLSSAPHCPTPVLLSCCCPSCCSARTLPSLSPLSPRHASPKGEAAARWRIDPSPSPPPPRLPPRAYSSFSNAYNAHVSVTPSATAIHKPTATVVPGGGGGKERRCARRASPPLSSSAANSSTQAVPLFLSCRSLAPSAAASPLQWRYAQQQSGPNPNLQRARHSFLLLHFSHTRPFPIPHKTLSKTRSSRQSLVVLCPCPNSIEQQSPLLIDTCRPVNSATSCSFPLIPWDP